jgi:hypothetical protein
MEVLFVQQQLLKNEWSSRCSSNEEFVIQTIKKEVGSAEGKNYDLG